MKTLRIIVAGRVQGVSFRAYTKDAAVSLGITGSVRNLENGSVEIIASGEEAALETFKKWAEKGPMLAKVSSIEVEEILFTPFREFTILR